METKQDSKNEYAISQYPDVEKVYNAIDILLSQEIRRINPEKMKAYMDYFDTQCSESKKMIEEAKGYIPGGVQHNLAFNYPFPLVITKAEGPYLYDIDGNRYIDFIQAGGATILGSNYKPVQEKVLSLIQECGPSTGLFHEYELKLAQEVHRHMPSVEMFRMLGSGTESTMAAIRAARVITKNKKVIKLGAAYHGWSDPLVFSLHIPGTRKFEAHGIPGSATKHTQEVFPNNIDAVKSKLRMNKLRGGTAAIIHEPLGPESGTRPISKEYNKQLRELCDDYDALLIFDEVVTGFRVGLGGAQGYFGVSPDLTTFGKIIGGGYPGAGGLGGKKEFISYLAAGVESGKKRAYVGGTLAATPITAVAGYHTIREIEKTNASVKAGVAGDKLREGLNEIISKRNLPFVVYNQGSIVHMETVATMFRSIELKKFWKIPRTVKDVKHRKHVMEEMGAAYTAEGIITLAGSRLYTSLATSDEVVEDALQRFDKVFANVD